MAGDVIYAFRVTRLPLLDAGGAQIGRIEDIVVVPDAQVRLHVSLALSRTVNAVEFS